MKAPRAGRSRPGTGAVKSAVAVSQVAAPPDKTDTSVLLAALEAMATDTAVPVQARTAAARAVLEARGVLGRHQVAPGDEAARRPLSEASRSDLEAELERLRLHFAAASPAKT